MSATIIILPVAHRTPRGAPCPRCFDLRFVSWYQMNEAQRLWAPAEAVLPCPDCGCDAQVIPFGHAPDDISRAAP